MTAGGTGYSDDATLAITGGAGDETDLTRVRDADIDGGIADAAYNVNQDLFSTEAGFQRAFLYLAAHCLCERMLAAGQGIRSRYNWLTSAKTVGDLSESFQIPKDILENPYLAAISKTRYGAMYLQIVTPLLVGNMMTSFRVTLP